MVEASEVVDVEDVVVVSVAAFLSASGVGEEVVVVDDAVACELVVVEEVGVDVVDDAADESGGLVVVDAVAVDVVG